MKKMGEMILTEKKFHNKVCFVAFLLSLMVVMIHGYNADMFLELPAREPMEKAVWGLQHFFAEVIGPAAVPGFFMISSYQFYRSCSFKDIGPKMERRIGTVLLPYIIWNFFYYLGYAAAGRIPFLAGFSDKTAVELNILEAADAVLHFTYNPVFWYMYQLIFLIALSPVIYLVMKNRYTGFLAVAAELYCIKKQIELPILNMDALFYYSAAAYGAFHGRRFLEEEWIEGEDRKKRRSTAWRICFTALGLLLAIIFYQGITVRHSVLETVLYRFTLPVTLWLSLSGVRLPDVKEWMKYGFFLYAIHFILARGLNKLGAAFLPHTAFSALLLYLLIPIFCVILAWRLGDFLKSRASLLWQLISGGR